MNAVRSAGAITSSILSNVPPQRSSTMLRRPNGPGPRLRSTTWEIGPHSLASKASSAAWLTPCSTRHAPRMRLSTIAWLPPLEPVGYIGCAASPMSTTGPSRQVGTGSRSIIGFSNTMSAPRSRHVEPIPDPAVEVMDEIGNRHLPEPAALLPALAVVQGDLGDPVDHGEAGLRVGMRDRVEH